MELSMRFLIFSIFVALVAFCVTLSTGYNVQDVLTTKRQLVKNQILEEQGSSRGDVKPIGDDDDDEAENPKRYEIRASQPDGSPQIGSPENDIGPASSTDVSVKVDSVEISSSPQPLLPPPSPPPLPSLPSPPPQPSTTESIMTSTMTDSKPEMNGDPPINPKGCKSIILNRIILVPRPEFIPFLRSLLIPISEPENILPQIKRDVEDQIGESSIAEPWSEPWPEPIAAPWPVSPWVHKKIIAQPVYIQKPPIVKVVKQPVYVSQPVKILKVPVIHKKHTIQYHKKPAIIGSIDKGTYPVKSLPYPGGKYPGTTYGQYPGTTYGQRVGQGGSESEPEGAEQNGAEQNGAEQNGAEQNGAEQNGAEQNGAEQNGAEQNGAEQGGAEQGGAEQNGQQQGAESDGSGQLNARNARNKKA